MNNLLLNDPKMLQLIEVETLINKQTGKEFAHVTYIDSTGKYAKRISNAPHIAIQLKGSLVEGVIENYYGIDIVRFEDESLDQAIFRNGIKDEGRGLTVIQHEKRKDIGENGVEDVIILSYKDENGRIAKRRYLSSTEHIPDVGFKAIGRIETHRKSQVVVLGNEAFREALNASEEIDMHSHVKSHTMDQVRNGNNRNGEKYNLTETVLEYEKYTQENAYENMVEQEAERMHQLIFDEEQQARKRKKILLLISIIVLISLLCIAVIQ